MSEVIWHRHKDVKPPRDGMYLWANSSLSVDVLFWSYKWAQWSDLMHRRHGDPEFWAECPKPEVENVSVSTASEPIQNHFETYVDLRKVNSIRVHSDLYPSEFIVELFCQHSQHPIPIIEKVKHNLEHWQLIHRNPPTKKDSDETKAKRTEQRAAFEAKANAMIEQWKEVNK